MNVYDDEENVAFVMALPEAPTVAWPMEEEDALPHLPDQPVAKSSRASGPLRSSAARAATVGGHCSSAGDAGG
eukprot:4043807-Heterocapsa_arctica.AAC.1